MFIVCAFVLAGCSDSDGDVTVEDSLAGNWYSTKDETIYTVEFHKDGTGELAAYTYSSIPGVTGYYMGWTAKGVSFQYTLVENLLTVKPAVSGEVLVAVAGITGNSMSLTDGDFAVMLTRYDGSEEKINELKKEYEDNLEELLPDGSHQEENFWQQESYVQSAIFGIYSNLRSYEYKQLLLEKIRLTGKDFDEHPAPAITSYDSHVSDAWSAAYRVISNANVVINALEAIDDSYERTAYINEAKVLRCMVYYNLSQLWGNVPYVTVAGTSDNYDEILHSPIRSPQDLCWELANVLQDITHLPGGEWRITMETVKALRAEIVLSLGSKEEAGYLLRDCRSDFNIAIGELSAPEMYRVFGESLANYTPEKTALLLKEAGMEATADKSALPVEWKARKQDWGYWIMLKRTGLAQAVTGCETYELLMPLPQSEIDRLPALLQNPGY